MRLIDADALEFEPKQGVMNRMLFVGRSAGKTIAQVQNALRIMIDNAPTIDAEPVRHGRWLAEVNFPGTYAHCSECGCRCRGHAPNYKYCPECGANMRGVVDGEEKAD